MTTAFGHDYEELHRLIDLLPPERVRALRAVVVHLVEGNHGGRIEPGQGDDRRRRLSFIGIMDAEPDLAARSEEILRDEIERSAS